MLKTAFVAAMLGLAFVAQPAFSMDESTRATRPP